MLTRAISAPAHYGAPGILRYNADSLPPMHSAVKFAPLPQTEVFGRRAKFSSRLGVQGRSGILSKQRQHPDGINYDPNNATKDTTETTNQDDAAPERNGHDATHGSTLHQASEKGNLPSPQLDSSLDLRRSASEDGTVSTSSAKRGSSLKFWKKPSNRPTLPTIPSQTAIYVPDLPPPSPQVAKEDGSSAVPPVPHVEIVTSPASAGQSHELQVHKSEDANSSTTAVDISANPPSTPSSSTRTTNTFTLDFSPLSTPPIKNVTLMPNVVGKTVTEGVSEKTGVKPTDLPQSDAANKSEIESLEVPIHILDGKGTPPIAALVASPSVVPSITVSPFYLPS